MPLGEEKEEWTVWVTREGLWERYRTLGQVAVLEGEGLEVSISAFCFLLSGISGCVLWDGCANLFAFG